MKKIRIIKDFYNLPVGESLDIGEYTITAKNLVDMGFAEWVDEPEGCVKCGVKDGDVTSDKTKMDCLHIWPTPQLPSKIEKAVTDGKTGEYIHNLPLEPLEEKFNALIDVVAYLLAKDK